MSARKTPTAANAILELFGRCKDSLPVEQLNWCADLNSAAELEADNIAATRDSLASLISGGGNKSCLPGDDQLAQILWGLAYRAETGAALVNISGEAAFMVAERKAAAYGQ